MKEEAAAIEAAMKQVMESDAETKPERVYVDFTDGFKALRTVVKVEDVIESQGREINDALERTAMLSLIDEKWTEHLRSLDEVKEGIGLRAFGQKDPLIEYKMEAFRLFKAMIEEIDEEVVALVFKAGPVVQQGGAPRQAAAPRARLDERRARTQSPSDSPDYSIKLGGGNKNEAAERDPTATAQPVIAGDRVGRNDPCPCGSGKKYKHCHGRLN